MLRTMGDTSFWDHSWKSQDREKLFSYIDSFDYSADAIIQFLHKQGFNNICDAGCGCGIYSLKLTLHGFSVSGFDVSEYAVELANCLLSEKGYLTRSFRTADVLSTGYADGQFDAVVARDVIDHMPIQDGRAAVKELLRIVRPGGCVLLTLDGTDDEYEAEPHEKNDSGDYIFTDGKWKGMIFHPFSVEDVGKLAHGYDAKLLASSGRGNLVVFKKHS